MVKCVACGKFLSTKGGATCTICRGGFHRACADVPESAAVPRDWSCAVCAAKQTGSAATCETPLRDVDKAPVPNMLGVSPVGNAGAAAAGPAPLPGATDETAALRRELTEYMAEQRVFREEIRAAVAGLTGRMNDLERRLGVVESRETEAVPQSNLVEELRQTVTRLQSELSDRDQDALLSDLDIGHIPEVQGENVVHTVTVLAAKLGVALEPRDVVFAERVGAVERGEAGVIEGGTAGRPRRIVVRLARRQLRDDMLKAARVRRNFTSAEAGLSGTPRRVYVNERLTRSNRLLFHQVRELCRKQQWKFAWTKRGRVFARQADGKQAYCIRSDADCSRVFGISPV